MSDVASFTRAYIDGIKSLLEFGADVDAVTDKSSPGSHFGSYQRQTKEIINYTFSLSDPRDRVLSPQLRRTDIVFAIANCIWTLRGTDDASIIIRYNPKGAHFSRDGLQYEAAFGSRLFGAEKQIDNVIRRLNNDPCSRRGFAAIYDASDTVNDRLDVPCALGLQFYIREGRLHCIVLMRSQSAIKVLPYDVFLFTVIHELVALRLGVPLGRYTHQSLSFHFYSDETSLVDSIITNSNTSSSYGGLPSLRSAKPSDLELVFCVEERLRQARTSSDLEIVDTVELEIDDFWRAGLSVLKVFFMRTHGLKPNREEWKWLPLAYQELLW